MSIKKFLSRKYRFGIVFLLVLFTFSLWPEERTPASEPTSAYTRLNIEGFVVLVNPQVTRRKNVPPFQAELSRQLQAVRGRVPAAALAELQKVQIWVEWRTRESAAEFHPSRQWLSSHGYNPDKAGHIEIANVQNFVQWSRQNQPWMIMHELAHAYHFRVLSYDHPGVRQAYKQAVQKKIYEQVPYNLGGKQRAYALGNHQEYFAELSEAYFGENDYYPFKRAELKSHDPVGFALMRSVWN